MLRIAKTQDQDEKGCMIALAVELKQSVLLERLKQRAIQFS